MNVPFRFRAADAFLKSARDMGDARIINAAIAIYWATRCPATKPASSADVEIFREWKLENGWA